MNKSSHIERALFLMGAQETGKSTQLRSMFLDPRLGTGGQIPVDRNLVKSYPLSTHRWLYLRLTSPHESRNEDMQTFLDKCARRMTPGPDLRRWNFAGALQIARTPDLPNGCQVIKAFVEAFSPERVRAVILSPTCQGKPIEWDSIRALTENLRDQTACEVAIIDATRQTANGLMLADFFDFT